MVYQQAIAVPFSGNPWIDGLVDGERWGVTSAQPEVGFTFISSTVDEPGGRFGGYPSRGWSETERALMLDGMAAIERVSGLRFIDRGDSNDDEVEIWFYNLDNKAADGAYGFSYTPGSGPDEGLVAINWSAYERSDGRPRHPIGSGSFHGATYLHELSHGVGLKHPHDLGMDKQPRFPGLSRRSDIYRDSGLYGQNAQPWTQLTYVDKGARNGAVPTTTAAFGFLQTPGALDIAALQWLYGVNRDAALGDDVYRLPTTNSEGTGWQSIWDAGGRDRIDGARAREPLTIDLRNATLEMNESAGGYLSRVDGIFGGFTIAHDWDAQVVGVPAGLCIIEDATGGGGSDRLIGNSAGNRLKGRQGDDVLYGGPAGTDRLKGGPGRDQFWISVEPDAFARVVDFDPVEDRLVFDQPLEDFNLLTTNRGTRVMNDGRAVAFVASTAVDLELHAIQQSFVVV